MTDTRELDRRTVLQGTATLGAVASVAGCSSLPVVGDDGGGGDGGLSYGDDVEDELTAESPTDPIYGGVANPHEFTGSADDQIQADLDSSAFDTMLLLVDAAGELVEENDNRSRDTTQSGFVTTLPSAGTYTLWVTSVSGEATGPYTLSLGLY